MKKNQYIDVDEHHDFGFSFSNEEEIISSTNLNEEVQDLKNRLEALNKMFMPLLINLSKDADKPMIKWPGRKDILDKQIKKLKELTNIN